MPRRSRLARTIAASALFLAIGCSGSTPTAPSPTVALSFLTPVQARVVTCATCLEEPTVWAAAEFPVTLSNPTSRERTLVALTTRVVNRTRGGEIARNVRPNASHAYAETRLPAGGSLTIEAGIVYFPLPPPRDETVVEVTAVLQDGTTITQSGLIVAS